MKKSCKILGGSPLQWEKCKLELVGDYWSRERAAAVLGEGTAHLVCCVSQGCIWKARRTLVRLSRGSVYTLDGRILSSSWINHWHVHIPGKLWCIFICSDLFVLFRYKICQSACILVALSLSRRAMNSLSCCGIIQSQIHSWVCFSYRKNAPQVSFLQSFISARMELPAILLTPLLVEAITFSRRKLPPSMILFSDA